MQFVCYYLKKYISMQCLHFGTHDNELGDHFSGFCLQKKPSTFSRIFEKFTISFIPFHFRNSSQVTSTRDLLYNGTHTRCRRLSANQISICRQPALFVCSPVWTIANLHFLFFIFFSLELKKSIDNTSGSVVITRITFTLILAKPLLQSLHWYRQH